jgi:hypothetical protein
MVGFVWPFGTPFEFSVTLFIILFIWDPKLTGGVTFCITVAPFVSMIVT